MMDNRNFVIGILSVTAVVLFVGLMVIYTVPEARGFGQSTSGGDYLVATGQIRDSTELIYVLDAATGRLLAYVLDSNSKRLQRVDGFPLDQLNQAAGKGGNDRNRGRGRGRGR